MIKKRTYTVDEAKKKLEYYCAYQERCHKEVSQKLKDMYMIPEAIDLIIVHLLEHNFLNEERFTKAFVSGKLKIKKWGKRRLTLELKKKNISKTNINQALTEIDDKEKDTYKKKKKLADYLLYRGWESFLVYDKVNELIK